MIKKSLSCSFSDISCTVRICTPRIRLDTQWAQYSEVAGTYTVLFYGCNFFNDLETIAFLDKGSDLCAFDPYASVFNHRIKTGVAETEAVAEANKFADCNTSFSRAQLSKIIAPNGDILGYEVRPPCYPFTYGVEDVLFTDYRIKDDKVVITIRLVPSVQRIIQNGSGVESEK